VSSLLLSDDRIDELTNPVAQRIAEWGTPPRLIVTSAARYADPQGTEAARFAAALRSVESSAAQDVPHIVMLDHASSNGVEEALRTRGAIVVPVGPGEEGLARPYITAARIIDQISRRWTPLTMLKIELEKDAFAGHNLTSNYYLKAFEEDYLDIATGVRDQQTWASMPFALGNTESLLGYLIGELLDVTYDTPSGVLLLNAHGRALLQRTTTDKWEYLISVPFLAHRLGLKAGTLPVWFTYDKEVAAEENGSAVYDSKRAAQFALMWDYAHKLAIKNGREIPPQLQVLAERFMISLAGMRSVPASESPAH